jgi:acetoin utilization protein AcuB
MININHPVRTIMTENPITIMENTTMDKVAMVFEKVQIHHIPVLNDEGTITGIISTNDFLQVQDKFSRFNLESSDKINNDFLPSLLASDVMSKNPQCIDADSSISEAIDIFLVNVFRAILVTIDDQLVGIVTPYDVLREVSGHKRELV